MRKSGIICACAVLIAAFLFTGTTSAQQLRVGFVNIQKLLVMSKRSQAEQSRLKDLQEAKRKQLEKMKEELLRSQEDLQKQSPLLNEERRNAKIKQIGIREMELKLAVKQAESDLQNAQRESQEIFMRDVTKIIAKLRKEKQLALVFSSGALISADDAFDITDSVIKAYDAVAAAGPRPAASRSPRRPSAPAKPARGGNR